MSVPLGFEPSSRSSAVTDITVHAGCRARDDGSGQHYAAQAQAGSAGRAERRRGPTERFCREFCSERRHALRWRQTISVTTRRRDQSNYACLATSIEQLSLDVIERASAGEREAIDRLLRVMQRPFYNLALRMLGNRSAAEDATQECLLRVITHLSQYRSEAKFATWATRVAVNVLFDYRSGLAREARMTFQTFSEMLRESPDETATERPEDALLLKQAKTQCSRALLQCLDGNHRMAFVLGEILEFDASDASEILGLHPAAYRKQLSRARAELTAVLSRECSVHSAGRACACHRRVGFAIKSGRMDPAQLEVRIGDLASLRTRLAVLDADHRTLGMYQGDETPDLRDQVLNSVRDVLFQMGTATN